MEHVQVADSNHRVPAVRMKYYMGLFNGMIEPGDKKRSAPIAQETPTIVAVETDDFLDSIQDMISTADADANENRTTSAENRTADAETRDERDRNAARTAIDNMVMSVNMASGQHMVAGVEENSPVIRETAEVASVRPQAYIRTVHAD